MLGRLAKKVFGSKIERELKRIDPLVVRIKELEPAVQQFSDPELQSKTAEFRQRISQGTSLDDLLPEAFAVVREASRRVLGMRHFDVQMIGGIFLHEGKIAEMKTGEGKTLVATLPVYLNGLAGAGVHVVTVNDYLARRDAEWMGRVYQFLGMKVGVIVHGLTDGERQQSYAADITYGTNNEFGFDYLRDNMKFSLDQYVQRPLNFAIVDEVDSILIDEARTPLIISGSTEDSTDKYYKIDQIIPRLSKTEDYTIDEEHRTAMLTEGGVAKVEHLLGIANLYDPIEIETLHHVNQGLRAHTLYKLDVDYVVREGKVMIVDEFTGRLMPGRRWSDGLHQAIEAKEKVDIENENQTLATITFQNYFRMYQKLAGMTGTAETEAAEFAKIYNLDVMVVPTHMTMIRADSDDMVYRTEPEKFRAVVKEIKELNAKGQPVLVGTISIERSEILATLLKREGLKHHVLNAKHHEKEAEIVAQAGRHGAVTISTNMAGRGTDILLGGNPEFLAKSKVDPAAEPERYRQVLAEMQHQCAAEKELVIKAGGLHVLGTERHEARRIDNQLRGRSGRQGDPGSSRFYISLQDDLMRIFGSDRISNVMARLGMEEDVPIEHRWITRAIANAQRKVEARNFEIRKNLLEYDDVMNQQRKAVYRLRREILAGNTKDKLLELVDELVGDTVDRWIPDKARDIDWEAVNVLMMERFDFKVGGQGKTFEPPLGESVGQHLYNEVVRIYEGREGQYGPELVRHVEKALMLQTLDSLWKDHLLNMDHLREGIGLRGYGQKDPLLEYKREGFDLYRQMMEKYAEDVVMKLFRVRIVEEERARALPLGRQGARIQLGRGAAPAAEPPAPQVPAVRQAAPAVLARNPIAAGPSRPQPVTIRRETPKVGRNDSCPCGSGKKYKKCCGAAL